MPIFKRAETTTGIVLKRRVLACWVFYPLVGGKRDWSAYNEHRRKELGRFIRESKRVLAEVGPPIENPAYVTGRKPYTATSMFLTNLLRIYTKQSYRDVEAMLQDNEQLRRRLGLKDAPGRDTINRYAKTIDEEYLAEFNRRLVARLKKLDSASASMPPVSRSRSTRHVGALPRSTNVAANS